MILTRSLSGGKKDQKETRKKIEKSHAGIATSGIVQG